MGLHGIVAQPTVIDKKNFSCDAVAVEAFTSSMDPVGPADGRLSKWGFFFPQYLGGRVDEAEGDWQRGRVGVQQAAQSGEIDAAEAAELDIEGLALQPSVLSVTRPRRQVAAQS